MSLVAFVTSNAHYKVDTDSNNRTPTNFVRDDSYMSTRFTQGNSQPNIGAHAVAAVRVAPMPADVPVGPGASPSQAFIRNALAGGVLCSKCTIGTNGGRDGEIGNPTELSILRASYFADIDVTCMKNDAPIIAEVPFSSVYKFMVTVHEPNQANDGNGYNGKYVVHVKGAPD